MNKINNLQIYTAAHLENADSAIGIWTAYMEPVSVWAKKYGIFFRYI